MKVSPNEGGNVTVNGSTQTAESKSYSCSIGNDVRLEAVAASGWKFDGWSGGLSGDANPTSITVSSSKTVTASFINEAQLKAQDPNADAGSNRDYPEDASVTLDGSGSSDPLERSLNYKWEQVDGSPTVSLSGANSKTATFTAPDITGEEKCLTFRLTVTDAEGDKNSDEVRICITSTNVGPVALLANEYLNVDGGEEVTIDGSASYDTDGSIVSYAWGIIGGNSTITGALRGVLSAATGSTVSFDAPNVEGHLEIQLTVTDNEGATATQQMTLSISAIDESGDNESPTADAGDDQNVKTGDKVTLDGSQSFDPDGEIAGYAWELSSDGADVTINNTAQAQASFIAPLVTESTEFTFKLTVTDDEGASSFDSVTIMVEENQEASDVNGNGMLDAKEIKDQARDMNQDGIPDFEDPSSVSFYHVNSSEEAVGFFSCCGSTLMDIKNLTADDAEVPQQGKPDAEFPYGVFSYKITGLSQGADADVTFVLPEDVPDNAKFYKIADSGWQEISYQKGSEANRIMVTLTDGNPAHDADGQANGTIVDPSAIAITAADDDNGSGDNNDNDGGGSSGGGCFIKATKLSLF